MKIFWVWSLALVLVGMVAPFAYSKSDPNLVCSTEKVAGKVVNIDRENKTLKIQIRGGRTPVWQTVGLDPEVSETDLQKIHPGDFVQVDVLRCVSRAATKISQS